MRTKFSSLKPLLAALLVAGGVGVACSSHQRQPESTTTIAQAPLGQSTAPLPSDPSVAPPDAAEAPEQEIGPVHSLSSGAATPGTNTPTNPSTPPPTPASPNAPASTPAPNPMPPSGGAPVQGAPNSGSTGTGPTGTNPPPTPQSSMRSELGARPRDGAFANVASVQTPIAPSTVPEARGTFLETTDPYQARSDAGVAPPPPSPPPARDAGITAPQRDAGVTPPRDGGTPPPRDGGVAPPRDGGVGPGGRGDAGVPRPGFRNDAGIVNPIRGDGGLR